VRDADQSCGEISLRLIAGEAPAADPVLASHVGSCLRCFRTASEMRDVPGIASLLGAARQAAPDPGEAFWARFPSAVADAWAGRKDGRGRWRIDGWRRLLGWLRMPVPAALSGAAVTAVLMALVAGRTVQPRSDGPTLAAAAVEGAADDDVTSAAVPVLDGDEDPWSLLELSDVKGARARSDKEAPSALDDLGDPTPSAAEEVGMLDSDDVASRI
jgi:hypothetical protein